MIPLVLVAALTSALTPQDLEAQAARQVALRYERAGRRTPIRDLALSEAARKVARIALEDGAQRAADLVPLTEAVSFSGAHDPSPRALVIKGSPRDEALRLLKTREDVASDPASHLGVGAVVRGKASVVVLLFSDRKTALEPFFRTPPEPIASRQLCGNLEPRYAHPEVFLTRPDGTVERAGISKLRPDGGFCATVPLRTQGRYTVEVLAKAERGPEVAALFFVDVGDVKKAQGPGLAEPRSPEVAKALVLERINQLRAAHGRAPLTLDPEVSRIAQAYSDRMAKERFFAHVDLEGRTVGGRLAAAGYGFRGAGENLGMASGTLEAHFGIEHSPGHRRNLLQAEWKRLGIGIATRVADGVPQTILTEVFVDPLTRSGDPLADAYRAISEKRKALHLPALRKDPTLEDLARAHARRALAVDEPRAELPGVKLHDKVFAALDEVKSASVDFYVADSPALIDPASKAAKDRRYSLVGIGAVKGDSPRFGKDKYWVVVIYAATR